MDKNPKSLLCSNTKVLWETRENAQIKPAVFGTVFNERLSVQSIWKYTDPYPDENVCEIECIRGGAYACSKTYWEYLHGLNGLVNYGLDEELITMKIINNGGKLLLVKDWIVGHIYRSKFPYQVVNQDLIYNQLLIIELFFDGELKTQMQQRLYGTYFNLYLECMQFMEKNRLWVETEKAYMKSIKDYTRKFPQEFLT
jgi:Tfp pilus assembly protein PilZ